MTTAKLFANGGSQAVRLPKSMRFDGEEVEIRRFGDGVLLLPIGGVDWDDWFAGLYEFTDDFMAERNQPMAAEEREPFG